MSAFEEGVAALAQYKGPHRLCDRPQGPRRAAGDGTKVRLEVFLSNSKSRRARLSPDKLQALADLGLEWAQG